MSGIPVPEFDLDDDEEDYSLAFHVSPPQFAPLDFIANQLAVFGFSNYGNGAPIKCTSNSMVYSVTSMCDTMSIINRCQNGFNLNHASLMDGCQTSPDESGQIYDQNFTVKPFYQKYDVNYGQKFHSYGQISDAENSDKNSNNLNSTINHRRYSSGEDSCVNQIVYAMKITTNRTRIFHEYENSKMIPYSPYIVQTYDIFDGGNLVMLQMEICHLGDILNRNLEEIEIWRLIHHIGSALDVLHNNGFMHMDVSPSNILLTDKHIFKLGDFGTLVREGEFDTGCEGAGPYVSPEALLFPGNEITGRIYVTAKTDIFSLGLVLLELATGTFAPRGGDPAYSRIRSDELKMGEEQYSIGARGHQPVSQALVDLINSMIACNPDDRPSARQIAAHPWARGAAGLY
ncbi:TKL family protein kinase [Tritrichomonas foetus]|uniref:TKL family protein kinase n=1 Tax=Tritrichomonas foetus TaxID=1144522 RepID=A0A1J4KF40_9EUKA|nr:TKL family protein kinase [Tritrichomonas foetus]|eukprot:OHT10073.1 TKL family protein kinase [Tritrichomonas foetus]